MNESAPVYDIKTVYARLSNVMFGAFSTFSKDQINSRYMLFACDEPLKRFFMMTESSTDKIAELKANAGATLTVLDEAKEPEDTAEMTIKGAVTLLSDFNHPDVTDGLAKLGEKSPMVTAIQSAGSLGNYSMMVLEPSEIVFRIYADILRQVPATVLR